MFISILNMARRFTFKRKKVNVPRVVSKVVGVLLALYVGGTIVNEIGNVLVNTSSPFYKGLTLIGWTVGDTPTNGTDFCSSCVQGCTISGTSPGYTSCITSTSGSGILAVVGIIGIASVVTEFVELRMK